EIPQRLPGLVETLLDRGGSDWPPLPGLAAFLPAEPTALPAAPSPSVMPAETPPFLRDMPANALAVAVLAGMVLSVIWAAVAWSRPAHPPARWRDRTIPLLALTGMGVAAYLTFIETTGAQAVCGPMGDCNTVQQSEFARIFGVLPVGVAGIAGYGAILMAWILAHRLRGAPGERAALALPALALIGTLFSIYLTFLEPFVIGATCLWCLTSAVIITGLLWLSMPYRWRSPSLQHVRR
ncbi:MAG: vitamin K epoxide reductase family protein, partial [Roseiflexaceae bacterium]|nr:vitamin K epoxide reductase family protein [Roseiflexaceae bacterium]